VTLCGKAFGVPLRLLRASALRHEARKFFVSRARAQRQRVTRALNRPKF
jgi:hypothetical protein